MDEAEAAQASGIDMAGLLEQAMTLGADFGLQLVIAILIFIVGRIVARMIVSGTRKLMQKTRSTRSSSHLFAT